MSDAPISREGAKKALADEYVKTGDLDGYEKVLDSLPTLADSLFAKERIDELIEGIIIDRDYEGFPGGRGSGQRRAMEAVRDAIIESLRNTPPPELLEWEDQVWDGRLTGASTTSGKHWTIAMWRGTKEDPTYSLSVGDLLIIAVDLPSVPAAKDLAQSLQNVLSGAPETKGSQVYDKPASLTPAFAPGTKVNHLQAEWSSPATIEEAVVSYNVILAHGQGVGPLPESDLCLADEVDIELSVGENRTAITIAHAFVSDLLTNEFDRGRWAIEEIAALAFDADPGPDEVLSVVLKRFAEYKALSNSFWSKVGAWAMDVANATDLASPDVSPIMLSRPNYTDDFTTLTYSPPTRIPKRR